MMQTKFTFNGAALIEIRTSRNGTFKNVLTQIIYINKISKFKQKAQNMCDTKLLKMYVYVNVYNDILI